MTALAFRPPLSHLRNGSEREKPGQKRRAGVFYGGTGSLCMQDGKLHWYNDVTGQLTVLVPV